MCIRGLFSCLGRWTFARLAFVSLGRVCRISRAVWWRLAWANVTAVIALSNRSMNFSMSVFLLRVVCFAFPTVKATVVPNDLLQHKQLIIY
jgi:hypothetical protein